MTITKSFPRFVLLTALLVLLVGFLSFLSPQSVHAADTINSAQYLDTAGDGTVDRIRWTMDENVTACTYEAGDWAVNTVGDINVSITGLSCTGSDAILDILVSADANETGGATDPVISYTDAPVGGSVTLTGGDMTGKASQTATDGALPIILSRTYQDNGSDGSVDRLVLVFSETVTQNGSDLNQFNITENNLTGFTTASAVTGSGSSTLTLTVGATTDLTGVSGGTEPTVQYTQSGTSGNRVKDSASNDMASEGSASSISDGAAPVITTFTYLDNDGNNRIDRFTVTYSETVTAASFLSANDLTLTNVGDFTSAAFGADATDLITGSVTSTTVVLGTEATVQDTNEDSGNIAISTQNAFSLTDGTNTNSALGAQTQASFVDGAAPSVTITSSASNPTSTSPIPMTATFSDSVTGFVVGDITVGNGTAGSFSGSGAVYTFNVTPTNSGAVTVDIAAAVAIDGGGNSNTAATQFSITYNAPSGGIAVISTVPPVAPEGGFGFVINNDALATASQEVTLSFTAGSNVARMAISNSSGFDGAIQETYASPKTWMLSEGDGEKTVYVKFYNENGVATDVVSDSITVTTIIDGLEPQPALELLVEFTQFLAPDSVGDEVRNLQEVLANQGFDPGPADGIFGSRTCDAVKAFQSAQGLLADCKVGPNTQSALNALDAVAPAPAGVAALFTEFLVEGVRSDEVLRLQQFLNEQGFDPGPIDGIFGPRTESAVRSFQGANNLASDGIVGLNTRATLNSLLNQ